MALPELLNAGLILLLLFVTGFLGLKFKLPNVIVFILFGIITGSIISDSHILHFGAEVGIVLLFFMLGMEFPIKQLMLVAKKVFMSGIFNHHRFIGDGIYQNIQQCFYLSICNDRCYPFLKSPCYLKKDLWQEIKK